MDEKRETARRVVKTAQQGQGRQDTPPSFSPSVRRTGEGGNKAMDNTGGLRQTQAALDIAKSKMRQDAATPEDGAMQSFQEDGKTASSAASEVIRSTVKRRSVAKLDKKTASHGQRNPATFSDQTRHTSRPIKKDSARPQQRAATAHHDTTAGPATMAGRHADPQAQEAAASDGQVSTANRNVRASMRADHATRVKQEQQTRQAQLVTKKNAVKTASAKKGAGAATKGTTKVAGAAQSAAKTAASGLGKFALPALAFIPLIAIIAVVAIIVIVLLSPLGGFFSNNEDNPHLVSEIVSSVNSEYNAELAALRKQYEDQEYTVNVYYGIPDGDDGSKLDNWRDVITLYSLHKSNGTASTNVYNDQDVQNIRDLYFAMNPMSIETWTETVEVEVEKEVETTKTVYNPKTGKFEKVTVTETVTEMEEQTIQHADIWINNMRYVSMLTQYELDEAQIGEAEFMLSYEHDPLWVELGLRAALSEGDYIGNVDDLIKNLPPGTKGTAIVQAALTRLGHPYSMDLRGQGNYIDCSGLTQWAYGLAGIPLPNTAADQAKWCVDNGKVIDRSAAVPGDLIFYTSDSARVADRFMRIGHVGIYAGDGMMVDASSSKGCVVYRAVYGTPVLWARPHV